MCHPNNSGVNNIQRKDWDWIENRRDKDYLEDYVRQKEHEILIILQIYSSRGGISHNRLAEEVQLDPKNLRHYMKSLIKKGLVKKEKGLQGKYFPTEEMFKDQLLKADIFSSNFRFRLLKKEEYLVLTNQKQAIYESNNYPYCIDFATYARRYYKPLFTENDHMESILFELSNRVGAFVIYTLIQAMNPSNNNQSSLSAIEQDELVKKWAHISISQILPFLVWYFKDLVHRTMGHYPKDYDRRIEYMKKNSQYVFDKQTLELLLRAFRRLYPRLSYEFDKMIKEVPQEIEYYKKYTDYLHEKHKRQETCEHEYKEPVMTIYGYYGKQCSKCDHIKRVKMVDSEMRRV